MIFQIYKKYIKEDLYYKIVFIYFLISLLVGILYLFFIEFLQQECYFYTIIFFGLLMIKYQEKIKLFFKNIKIKNQYLLPILVGYSMVLFEEFFAALFNHLTEEFSISIFLLRIFQFQFFNIFAFTGLILTLTYLLKKYEFSKKEFFIFVGIFSVFSEGLFSNIFFLVFWGIVNAIIYCIIFYPIYLSIEKKGTKKINIYYNFLLFALLLIFFTIIISPFVDFLRNSWPFLFPPVKFIPL